jgi:phosphatidylglycerol:prolipoprotein diacylglycerol transferase
VYPELLKIGPFTVYSFGLMMGVGFIVASFLLTKELTRKRFDASLGSTITLFALVFGVIGSKLLYLIENWSLFIAAPLKMAFSPGGLTWYGGFILATLTIWQYTKKKKVPFLAVCDAASPALALGYGIARIGCHLAGDGDYGMPTDLPWASSYSKGTYPPSAAFRDFPDVVAKYGVDGVVPDDILVHPAPLYETLLGIIIFVILWRLRTKFTVNGKLFMLYLILSGIARFGVEFIRLNERILFGLSEAQLIAVVLILMGAAGLSRLSQRQDRLNSVSV